MVPTYRTINMSPDHSCGGFNIAMLACKKTSHHTTSDVEMQPDPKKQPQSNSVLWCHKSRHTRIKKETEKRLDA